jgi:outer membrane protein OmpA-like peptidoglycan-associated protein
VKKTAMISVLAFTAIGWAQGTQPAAPQAQPAAPQATAPQAKGPVIQIKGRKATSANQPTQSDMYCGGFIASERIPTDRYIVGGWNSPDQTRYASPSVDMLYIHGKNMNVGDRFSIIRHAKDVNHYEFYPGQGAAVRELGDPYFEMGYVKVVNVQREVAVAVPELACADFVTGDIAVPFAERTAPHFRKVPLDRFAPPSGKTQGRIVMGHEFDGYLATKSTAMVNLGADRGLKVGDYLRVTRTYNKVYGNAETSLAMKASAVEDTQAEPYKQTTDVSGLPLQTLGDMIVLEVHKKSATAMVVTSLQEIQVGDGVELMDVSAYPELSGVEALPAAETAPAAVATSTADPSVDSVPRISCTGSPLTLRPGDTGNVNCDASSPDNRPISITFVTNAGKLSSSRNQAKLDTTDVGPGPIAVRATVFDDRQLSASATTTFNVEAPPAPQASPQKMTDLDFKPSSAYVDNRSKAILDDVALKMQQDPTSTAVIVGSSDEKESAKLATQRADNAKTYLTASKGIDAQRIQTQAGKTPGHTAQVWTLPAGAKLPQ